MKKGLVENRIEERNRHRERSCRIKIERGNWEEIIKIMRIDDRDTRERGREK